MEQRTREEATREQTAQEQTTIEEQITQEQKKVQMLFNFANQPNMKLDDDPEEDKRIKAELEEALQSLTFEDLKNSEKALPFQGEIEDLLKDLVKETTGGEAFLDLQSAITDLASQAKKRQIYRNNAAKVKEYDAGIEELLTKIISMVKAIRQDAQGACSILTQRYVSKLSKEYSLDDAITEAIQKKLHAGLLGCFVGGAAIVAAGAGIAWSASSVAAAGALGVAGPIVLPAFAAAGLVVLGIGVWKIIESKKLEKTHPKLVEFYDEMKKIEPNT
jgi:hypothetical protein